MDRFNIASPRLVICCEVVQTVVCTLAKCHAAQTGKTAHLQCIGHYGPASMQQGEAGSKGIRE